MRLVIQVVQEASIKVVEENYEARIGEWLLIYVWVSTQDLIDYQQKIAHFVSKIRGLQIFHRDGKLIGTLEECGWEILLIPNFTLYWKNRKWLRFDFTDSAPFEEAKKIYEELSDALIEAGVSVKKWIFGAMMEITSINAGPINFVMEL